MSSRRSVRQLVVAVVVGVMVGGGLMAITPAGAEVSQSLATSWKKIWKKELKPLADKRYYTKKKSDKTYATKAEAAAAAAAAQSAATSAANSATDGKLGSYYKKTESDARYVAKRTVITGMWASGAIASGSQPVVAINFGTLLSAAPTAAVYRPSGSPATAQCPGTVSAPDAAPGILCVYEYENSGFITHYFFNLRPEGAILAATSNNNDSYMDGVWAVRPAGYAAPGRVAPSAPAPALTGSGAGR